jgi:hypothetical protein
MKQKFNTLTGFMKALFPLIILPLILSSCYAPRLPVEEDSVKIITAVTERHKSNYRLNIAFSETSPPKILADGDDLLVSFTKRVILSPAALRSLQTSAFPCGYRDTGEKNTLRFRCPKDIIIYPETADGNVDIIAQKKER